MPAVAALTILALGATGGCVLTVVAKALKAGHRCIALVRTKSKLIELLSSQGITKETMGQQLVIIEGDVKNRKLMKQALFHSAPQRGPVDIIVSGVGVYPNFSPNPFSPTFPDHTICEDAANTVLDTIHAGLEPGMRKPLFITVSTFGISDHGRDTPLLLHFLSLALNFMLRIPHADKKKMEQVLERESEKQDPAISGFTIVRASLLTDGKQLGIDVVRSDTEEGGKTAVNARGYTISRKDVGNWIYQAVMSSDEGREAYTNQHVRVTY